MPHYVASDLGLHCLPMTLLRFSRYDWVNRALLERFCCTGNKQEVLFSSSGRSPGRAIVLPPVSALASAAASALAKC